MDEREINYLALTLVALMVGIYALEHLVPSLATDFALRAATVSSEPWTMVTSFFLHSRTDFMHLLNNMFFLAVFGFMLEQIIGTKKFAALFLSAGLFANLSAFTFYPNSSVLGASGAISGIVAALAILRPHIPGLFWGVPVPMWAALMGWIGINVVGAGEANTAFMAHLYGLFYGMLAGIYLRKHHPAPEDEHASVPDDPEDELDIDQWEEEFMHKQRHG